MKKTTLLRGLLLSAAALAVTACGNLSNVSDEGTTDNPIFPKISESEFNHDGSQFGSWPNWDNVRLIEKGMNKEQIYNLIGRPHFEEGLFAVREWDYVFNYRENGVHKICQYKVLFDKNMNAQSFFWYPNGCNFGEPLKLGADFLFDFNKATLSAKGKSVVEEVAKQLKEANLPLVKVAGYTDRLGSDAYNMKLSQRRADNVKKYLIAQGVTTRIEAVGYGKANQVKACENENGKALKACLRPNRRVEISAETEAAQNQNGEMAGTQGSAILYQK